MARRLITVAEFEAAGGTWGQLRSLVSTGLYVRVVRGVYAPDQDPPTPFEIGLARTLVTGKPARGFVAGELYGFDSIEVPPESPRRCVTVLLDDTVTVVDGYRCVSALQALVDLAWLVRDDEWEQALESALRKDLLTVVDVAAPLERMSRSRHHGVVRMRRVLERRPIGAPPTDSLLETLMIQLARAAGLPEPIRQYRVFARGGRLIARLDLCWPELGLFIELDGKQHLDQSEYDAARQTEVTAITGWLCGRFTWRDVRLHPEATTRRLLQLVDQARRQVSLHRIAP